MAVNCSHSLASWHVCRYVGRHLFVLMAMLIVRPLVHVSLQAQQIATAPSISAAESRRITVDLTDTPLPTALHVIARQAGLTPVFDDVLLRPSFRVTLHVHEVPADQVIAQALHGTGLLARVHAGGQVVIVRAPGVNVVVANGQVVGTITDAKTKRPIKGAVISLDAATRGVVTSEDGRYRITAVPNGTHTLTVRSLGFTRQTGQVTVGDAGIVTWDVALEPSTNALDQVVVVGTVIPTELKAVPSAVTVITAKQIEARGITKIDQLFRGDVPGLFAQNNGSYDGALLDEVTMYSRGVASFNRFDPQTSAQTAYTNPIKTYVDGVEMADPKYLSQIDPKSIERIEILTGPQASTIYGSNAINGVMQIFTKRGTTQRPQLTLNLLSGFVQNDFSNALTPQHDYSAQLSGIEGRVSYNAGGSWNYVGPWTPAKQTTRTGGFGGVRLDVPTSVGRMTTDVTLRLGRTQNLQHGASTQSSTQLMESGWWRAIAAVPAGLSVPATYALAGQTLGMTVSYAPLEHWSHELGVGRDAEDVETRYTARGYLNPTDTTLYLSQTHSDRRSFRYTTTVYVPITSASRATVTVGSDTWQNLTAVWQVRPQTLTGNLTGSTFVTRQPGHNTGAFLQTQLGVIDRLFLTYGLRAEWNPNYGEKVQPNIAPKYGVAYTQEFGGMTAKVRGSYGRSTRPPLPTQKAASTFAQLGATVAELQDYGNFNVYLANPDLAPEYQQGGEGGIELYFGSRGSLAITRYNQTVDGLISSPAVDSVRSLTPNPLTTDALLDPLGYGYRYQYQYLNVGSIRNQGWELQGTAHVGPVSTRGTYSWTKSRTIGIPPAYRAILTDAQYKPGATFLFLPEHTWAAEVSYAHARGSVGLTFTGTGQTVSDANDFFLRNLNAFAIRLPQNVFNRSASGRYTAFHGAYVVTDLNAFRTLSSHLDAVVQVRNLTDQYKNDESATYASMGRQVNIGARYRL